MKSRFKLMGELIENEQKYRVYRDKKDNKVYKINDTELKEIKNIRNIELLLLSEGIMNSAKRNKNKKQIKKILATIACIGLLVCTAVQIYKQNEEKISYLMEEDTSFNRLSYLKNMLDKNSTATPLVKSTMLDYLNYLSKKNIKPLKIFKIGANLKEYDFSNVDLQTDDMIKVLDSILNLKDAGFLSRELYAYINECDVSEETLLMANIFFFEKNIDERLLNGEKLEDITNELFKIKIDFNNLSKWEIRELEWLNFKIKNVFKDVEEFPLYDLNHNICSEYVTFRYDDKFDIYGILKNNQFIDCSDAIYKDKLMELVYEEGDSIDYTNPNDRVLVYLYVNSIINNVKNRNDIVTFLYEGTEENRLFPATIGREDLFEFFTTGNLNSTNIIILCDLVIVDKMSVGLLQEVNLCLREEVKCGNIHQDRYDYFIDVVLEYLKFKDMEMYESFVDSTMKGKSVDGYKLELIHKDNF